MLSRCKDRREAIRYAERKTSLLVVLRALGIAVPPAWVDAVDVLEMKIPDATEGRRVKARFFQRFACGGFGERFAGLL